MILFLLSEYRCLIGGRLTLGRDINKDFNIRALLHPVSYNTNLPRGYDLDISDYRLPVTGLADSY